MNGPERRNVPCMLRVLQDMPTLPPLSPDTFAVFHGNLLAWYRQHQRPMPWRDQPLPYYVWLSETMLQQTRVDQATPYFLRFIEAFPTLKSLSEADLDTVLLMWEGLGYYARARNLHRAAQIVMREHGRMIPSSYETFRALPGVGPYTAAAVLSIAFGAPYAALDGNVMRVLTRVFTLADDITRPATRTMLQALGDALLDRAAPGDFNQAMMELGARVCTPQSPACPACPLATACNAFATGTQLRYPVKPKKAPLPHHDVAIGLLRDAAGRLLIQRRAEEGLLGGLWEFPGGKKEPGETLEAACEREFREELGVAIHVGPLAARVNHAYTHFKVTLHAFRCTVAEGTPTSQAGLPVEWVFPERLHTYAFPRGNRKLLAQIQAAQQEPTLFG